MYILTHRCQLSLSRLCSVNKRKITIEISRKNIISRKNATFHCKKKNHMPSYFLYRVSFILMFHWLHLLDLILGKRAGRDMLQSYCTEQMQFPNKFCQCLLACLSVSGVFGWKYDAVTSRRLLLLKQVLFCCG